MAWRWRIRHKLWLGFGLVIAIIGLLLAGTFYGLSSYRTTRHAVDNKLNELTKVDELREHVKLMFEKPTTEQERHHGKIFHAQLQKTIKKFKEYQTTLAQSRQQRFYKNDIGHAEILVKAIDSRLVQLKAAFDPYFNSEKTFQKTILDEQPIKEHLDGLSGEVRDLKSNIRVALGIQSDLARDAYRGVTWWVAGISLGGILLLALMIWRFYSWIVQPVRDLQRGVEQVAQGDFEHRIDVNSGDEMEELAGRFNHMTDELQALYTDLEQQVNERSRQLVRSERLASVGFLAAGVAHEINNPMASIAFCSEALEDRLQDYLVPEERLTLSLHRERAVASDRETITKYLKMIQDEAFRCKKITERLLEFSRGGEGRREPTDMNALIESVLDVVQHLPTGRDKTLDFQPAGTLIAHVNAQEIQSVVLNLVINSLESMDEGGTLTITHRLVDRRAEIRLTDTGCGMDEEVLDNIFEPFYTRSRTGKGTGLGLSISHRIINQHGGEIEAFSAGEGRGSTFTVRLPLKPAESATPSRPSSTDGVERPERRAA